jgi:hypothetical protein
MASISSMNVPAQITISGNHLRIGVISFRWLIPRWSLPPGYDKTSAEPVLA